MTPTRIIWHHSADISTKHQFEKIDHYHRTRDFPKSSMGFFVGYHWLIEFDGTVKQARREDEIGAHDQGENLDSIGICLTGNFNIDKPSAAQTVAVAKLVGQIRERWNISAAHIEPHRWNDTTDCPGKLLRDNWLIMEFLKYESDQISKLLNEIGTWAKRP